MDTVGAGLAREDYESLTDLVPCHGIIHIQSYMLGFYLTEQDIAERMQPVLDAFDWQLARQQAFVERYGVYASVVAASEGLSDLAGTGLRRYRQFQHQMDTLHQAWRAFFYPRVLAQTALVEGDFLHMPRFQWHEEHLLTLTTRTVLKVAVLLLLTLLLGGWSVYGVYTLSEGLSDTSCWPRLLAHTVGRYAAGRRGPWPVCWCIVKKKMPELKPPLTA